MAVLTAECDRAFVVDKEQTEAFLSVKPNEKIRKQAEITVSKISSIISNENKSTNNDKT